MGALTAARVVAGVVGHGETRPRVRRVPMEVNHLRQRSMVNIKSTARDRIVHSGWRADFLEMATDDTDLFLAKIVYYASRIL